MKVKTNHDCVIWTFSNLRVIHAALFVHTIEHISLFLYTVYRMVL